MTFHKTAFVSVTLLTLFTLGVAQLTVGDENTQPATQTATPTRPPVPEFAIPVHYVTNPDTDFALAVNTDKPEYQAGERVMLYVTLAAQGEKDFALDYDPVSPFQFFDIKVTGQDGTPAPVTVYSKWSVNMAKESYKLYALGVAAKQTKIVSFPLNRYFDLSWSETYKVSVTAQPLSHTEGVKIPKLTADLDFIVKGEDNRVNNIRLLQERRRRAAAEKEPPK